MHNAERQDNSKGKTESQVRKYLGSRDVVFVLIKKKEHGLLGRAQNTNRFERYENRSWDLLLHLEIELCEVIAFILSHYEPSAVKVKAHSQI